MPPSNNFMLGHLLNNKAIGNDLNIYQDDELPPSNNFMLGHLLNNKAIGNDLNIYQNDELPYDATIYPYLTAELAGGMQVTKHRRVVVTKEDTQALAFCKLGSGGNLLGYYMYHGGTNPKGKLSTLQE